MNVYGSGAGMSVTVHFTTGRHCSECAYLHVRITATVTPFAFSIAPLHARRSLSLGHCCVCLMLRLLHSAQLGGASSSTGDRLGEGAFASTTGSSPPSSTERVVTAITSVGDDEHPAGLPLAL